MYQYKDLYTIDFTEVNYYLEMHAVIWEALDFPDYYGCNWDAFWDCLTDMVGRPINVKIVGIENIENKFADGARTMLETLQEFKNYRNGKYANDISIIIIRNNENIML